MPSLEPFSEAETARRRRAVEELLAARGLEYLVVYEADRAGSAVGWLTGWPTTREAVLVLTPAERDVLFVQFYNHVPNARRLARAEVRWGGPSTVTTVLEELERRGARRVGLVGSPSFRFHHRLVSAGIEVVDLHRAYVDLRLVKSDEEVERMREGARLSDLAVRALLEEAHPGMSEIELAALIESAYVPEGGTTHIHYLTSTSMASPDGCVPGQYPTDRRLEEGDALVTELSASAGGYAGQVLRTFTVAADPTPLYRELHDTAEAAFRAILDVLRDGTTPEEVVAAASVIEEAGFTTYDDLLHGYGGGYLPPVLGSHSRPAGPLPDLSFRAGMTVVIQPNVITPDERAGVQTGELVLVTGSGAERLHTAPQGLLRIG